MTRASMPAPDWVGVMPGTPQAAWTGSADRGMDALGWTAGRVSLRVTSVIDARVGIASECSGRVSSSRTFRRVCDNQASDLSTTQYLGKITKPLAPSGLLTVLIVRWRKGLAQTTGVTA